MNKNRLTVSIISTIAFVLLLVAGTGSNAILFNNGYSQKDTLGEPILVERGGESIKREIGPNTALYIFNSSGTLNGSIEYNKKGEYVSISKGNNLTFEQGKGILTTKDGSETANYTFIEVGNGTDYQGASVYSTNSTGKLSFLNNILLIYKGGVDESGNYAFKQWRWK